MKKTGVYQEVREYVHLCWTKVRAVLWDQAQTVKWPALHLPLPTKKFHYSFKCDKLKQPASVGQYSQHIVNYFLFKNYLILILIIYVIMIIYSGNFMTTNSYSHYAYFLFKRKKKNLSFQWAVNMQSLGPVLDFSHLKFN